MQTKKGGDNAAARDAIAKAFVRARRAAQPLKAYPGVAPQSLDEAYAIQDLALGLWSDRIAGWKVGRINGATAAALNCNRLAGPIFKGAVREAGDDIAMPVFDGGFAAVEAECVLILAEDAPEGKTEWATEEAQELIGSVVAGIEIASSPFAGINDLGPLVTISDFGNNNGLIIGEELPGWSAFDIDDWIFETLIDGQTVGVSAAGAIPGGPVESLRFLLENTAKRGMALKKGMTISSGAVTGVHEIKIGQEAVIRYRNDNVLRCHLIAATPANNAGAETGKILA